MSTCTWSQLKKMMTKNAKIDNGITNANYSLIPAVLKDIIRCYIGDYVCIDSMGQETAYNDNDEHKEWTGVVEVVVLQRLTITGDTEFDGCIQSIHGPGKVTLIGDMSCMFSDASSFNGDVSQWNTAAVTDMAGMFSSASYFNGDVSQWNTAAVTNMRCMFSDASSFNGDVSQWNTAAVTNMSCMFYLASSFNGDVSQWNTAAVTDMAGMFSWATSFNGDVSQWNTAAVTKHEMHVFLGYIFQR